MIDLLLRTMARLAWVAYCWASEHRSRRAGVTVRNLDSGTYLQVSSPVRWVSGGKA